MALTGFENMHMEFEEWKNTQEAFTCVATSDFAEVWMTAYRAGEKAEREACAKVCEDLNAYDEYDPNKSFATAIRQRSNV